MGGSMQRKALLFAQLRDKSTYPCFFQLLLLIFVGIFCKDFYKLFKYFGLEIKYLLRFQICVKVLLQKETIDFVDFLKFRHDLG